MSDPDVLAYEPSPIGMIRLQRRELLSEPGVIHTEILVEHEMLMSSGNSVSERALASLALEMHPGSNLRVLVGGLGLGYTAGEVLQSQKVERVEVIELLPQVIDWFGKGLLPLSAELQADRRLHVRQGDVYGTLLAPPEVAYDLVLVDVDHAPEENLSPKNSDFYAAEGLARARNHLKPGGVLGIWSYTNSPTFEATLRRCFRHVLVKESIYRNSIDDCEDINWLYFGWD